MIWKSQWFTKPLAMFHKTFSPGSSKKSRGTGARVIKTRAGVVARGAEAFGQQLLWKVHRSS